MTSVFHTGAACIIAVCFSHHAWSLDYLKPLFRESYAYAILLSPVTAISGTTKVT
jgi:hypothetical protein